MTKQQINQYLKPSKNKFTCKNIFFIYRETAGQFNGIWDRGSLVAINRQDRQK